MRLENEDVLFSWPLAAHVITAGWLYNDGSLHRAPGYPRRCAV